MKNSSDTIRTRTRDCPVCSVVPQPNEPPPQFKSMECIKPVMKWTGLMWLTMWFVDEFWWPEQLAFKSQQ
jgi:hypothetical protein